MTELRIVLLGKTGDGKSSTGNTILGETFFSVGHEANSHTQKCESKRNFIYGRKITVVDTPGFFDTSLSEEELNSEIVRCITECAPGPHAFLIVLSVGRYTEHEKEVVRQITASFGEEALKYAVVLFTHGNELPKNQTIEEFVTDNTELGDLVKKCGGRVHVIDNKYWKQQQDDDSRNNRVQLQKLLNTIEAMVKKNKGQCYTNEVLQLVHREIEEEFKKAENEGTEEDRRQQAKQKVYTKLSVRLVGMVTGALLGALLGVVAGVACVFFAAKAILTAAPPIPAVEGVVATGTVAFKAAVVGVAGFGAVGGVVGAVKGYDAAEGEETMSEAMDRAASATLDTAKNVIKKIRSSTTLNN